MIWIGKYIEAKKVVGTSTVFFLVLSVGVAFSGWIFSSTILDWMNTPPDVKEFAVATFSAQLVSFMLLIAYLYKKKYFLRITKEDIPLLRINWSII